jgi:transposase
MAVRMTVAREEYDTRTGAAPRPKPAGEPKQYPQKTYKQLWPQYNAAQTNEQDHFQALLAELCSNIVDNRPRHLKGGRPRLPLADALFAVVFKVYSTVSSRRFMCDLQDAHERGHISRLPHYNSIPNYLEDEAATPILRNLLTWSALPLAALERTFVPDSSGFSTCKFDRWYDAKYGRMHQEHSWIKAHIMCGVLTNVVTAVEIQGKDTADNTQLPALVKTTALDFQIDEVPADKAYGTIENYDAIAAIGATPYIAFKSSATGWSGGLWQRMFLVFSLEKDDFLRHYHQRSNVESTFSMVKRKFGDSVRSKTDVAMKNEVLCKFVAHNICCVIQSMYEFEIEPNFVGIEQPAEPVILPMRRPG